MKTILSVVRFGIRFSKLARSTAVILAVAALTGCPSGNQNASTPSPAPSSNGKIVIRGSNTFGEELAPKLITAFKKDHASADFDMVTKATGYGLAALRVGQCDIAAASRTPNKDEVEEQTRMGVQLNDYPIGSYSVAVVVNSGNAVGNLTREQVRDIFTGKIQNWKGVGGADLPIHIYARDPISGTYLGFKELAMEDKAYAEGRKLATNYDDIAAQVAKDDGGIGYCGVELPSGASVKAVTIGGVEATAANVNSEKYPYARLLHLYTQKGSESSGTKDFIQFILSAPGQDILKQMGFVPHQ